MPPVLKLLDHGAQLNELDVPVGLLLLAPPDVHALLHERRHFDRAHAHMVNCLQLPLEPPLGEPLILLQAQTLEFGHLSSLGLNPQQRLRPIMCKICTQSSQLLMFPRQVPLLGDKPVALDVELPVLSRRTEWKVCARIDACGRPCQAASSRHLQRRRDELS